MSYNFLDLINTKKAAVHLSNNHKLSFPRWINVQNFQPKLKDALVWMVSARHCQGSLTTRVCLKIKKMKKFVLLTWCERWMQHVCVCEVQRHKNIQIFLPPRSTDNKLLGILENKETTWRKSIVLPKIESYGHHAEIMLYSLYRHNIFFCLTKAEYLIRNEIRNRFYFCFVHLWVTSWSLLANWLIYF